MVYVAVQLTVSFGARVVAAAPQLKAVPSGLPMWSSVMVNWAGPIDTLPVFVMT